MNNLINYKTLVALQAQENVLMKERDEEDANLHILTLRKKDLFLTEDGKKYAQRLITRANNFYKSIKDDEKDTTFLLINNKETTLGFKNYLMDNVKKENEINAYNEMFEDFAFVRDVERLLQEKSFYHKSVMESKSKNGFWSKNARAEWNKLQIVKYTENILYSAVGRSRQNYIHLADGSKARLTAEQENQQKEVLTEVIMRVVNEAVEEVLKLEYEKDNLPSIENSNNKKLNNRS